MVLFKQGSWIKLEAGRNIRSHRSSTFTTEQKKEILLELLLGRQQNVVVVPGRSQV